MLLGQGRFAADISFPGQWHMRVVRSSIAHGKIKSIDASATLKLPGVHAVWTAADIAHIPPIPFLLDPDQDANRTASRCWRLRWCATSANRSR